MLLRSLRCLALVGALVCGTGISQAQMMMQMNTPKFPLLASKPVQQELKLTDEQTKKIQAKIKELMPKVNIVIVTVYEDSERIFQALRAGVAS